MGTVCWRDGKVLEVDSGDGLHTFVNMLNINELYT